MLESLEASAARFAVRRRCRAIKVLFGQPTIVNNVITLFERALHPRRRAQAFYRDSAWASHAARSRSSSPAT
jgi:NADH:ubiquinone oxidoreductase subunit F (NADH-binding)